MTKTNIDLLTRRVDKILPSKQGLEELIKSKKKIRLYQGFDPTASSLHLGHTIGMRKLMDFARAGHEVIFLFGTGTVLAGDPSKREKGRGNKIITQEQIDENIKDWKRQVEKIVDFDLVTIKQNGDWLTKLDLRGILGIASNISATQLFKRESFTRRIAAGDPVWYHETMYPLLQGYDSVVMDVDLEVGGTDQEFNMLIGRELQKKMNSRDKFVLTTPMIDGTDGKKMSKSVGNCIFLTEPANDIYQKIMAMSDEMVPEYFKLLTDIPLEEIASLDKSKPIENKKRLAHDITRQLHDESSAQDAAKYYDQVVSTKSVDPNEAPIMIMPTLFETLKAANLGVSNSEIKRVVSQGGVEIDGKKLTDLSANVSGSEIKFGKSIRRKLTIPDRQ